MASESETVMAVCAEWRACIEAADPSVWNDERIAGLVETTKAQQLAYLDRIEAAWKRERDELIYAYDPTKAGKGRLPDGSAYALEAMLEPVTACHAIGNAAAMRDALELVAHMYDSPYTTYDVLVAVQKARAALAAPARQCDVGTAEEQSLRFNAFCMEHHCDSDTAHCKCKFETGRARCELAWAQTPYAEEGGAE